MNHLTDLLMNQSLLTQLSGLKLPAHSIKTQLRIANSIPEYDNIYFRGVFAYFWSMDILVCMEKILRFFFFKKSKMFYSKIEKR